MQNLENMGVSRSLRLHFGNAHCLRASENSVLAGGSNCQRADIIQWIMLYGIGYLVGTGQSMRKRSWPWSLGLGESSYGMISKAVPAWYLPKDCVVPNRLLLLSITKPRGYSPSAPVSLWTTLYFHGPLFCGMSL